MSLVAGVGVPTIDRMLALSSPLASDASMLVTSRGMHGGGQVATALVAVARLGHTAQFVAVVGDDPDGKAVVEDLAAVGVATDLVRIARDGRTASSVILVAPDGSRTILYDPGEHVEPDLTAGDRQLLADADAVTLAGTTSWTREAARSARGVTVLDLDFFDTDEQTLVCDCDIVIASAAYASSRSLEPGEAAHRLRGFGCEIAIVTLGAEGAVGVGPDGEHVEPAYPVEVVDTTGAGDVYHGAYLVAALEGMGLAQAMRFAAVVSALKCRASGGRVGIPTRPEVAAILG